MIQYIIGLGLILISYSMWESANRQYSKVYMLDSNIKELLCILGMRCCSGLIFGMAVGVMVK